MANSEPTKKRVKRDEEDDESGKSGLFLKPLFAKRSWYRGGKVLISRDGSTVFCAHEGGVAVVSDFATISQVLATGDDVVSFALANGPQTIATCSRRGLIRIFRHDFHEMRTFNSLHSGVVSEMDFDPTGECLATGSTDFSVRVFSASGGFATHNFRGHRGIISAIKFHPNEGNLSLLTGDVTGAICMWDLRTKKNVWFRNHMGVVPSISFLGQNMFVSVGRDRVLNVWSKDNPASPLKTVPTFEIMEAVVTIDGSSFVTGGAEGVLKKWTFDQKSKECQIVESVEDAGGDGIVQLSVLKNSKGKETTLLSVSQTECILSFRSLKNLKEEVRGKTIGSDDEIYDLCTVGGNNWNQLAVATNSPIVRIYSFNEEGKSEGVRLLVGHEEAVLSIASHPNFIVTGSKDQKIRVWDLPNFDCIATCEGHTDAVSTVATCNKPSHKLFVSGSDDNSIRLWSVEQNTAVSVDQRMAHSKALLDVCFSPNDEMIATASADKMCKLWTVEPQKKGKFKIIGPTLELKGHRRAVNSVRFSTMDRVVCTASADTTVRVWSIASGACVRTLQSHTSPVTSALFMSNGTSLVSSGSDGTIKTWDLKSSTCSQTLHGAKDGGHDDRIWALAWCVNKQNEQFIASVGVDGVISVWRDATQEEKQRRLELQKEEILNKEELERSIREKRFLEAAKLALKLDRPHQLRLILEMISKDEVVDFIRSLLEGAERNHAASFLNAVISWNTLSRTSLVAQRTISACVDIGMNLAEMVGKAAFSKFLAAAQPYTERHFTRIDRLLKGSYLLDRVLESDTVIV